jgi:exonuclease SbcC
LEALLAAAPPPKLPPLIAEIREIWSTLPALPAAQLEPIQQRFDTVVQALSDADNADPARELRTRLEQNLERKRIHCVSMEIIAGMESPPDCAQLRMEYQVARLSASLTGAAAKTDTAP